MSVDIPSADSDVVGGCGGNWGHIKGQGVGPLAWEGNFLIREVFVVGEHTEEMALKVHVVDLNRLSPDTAKVEVDSGAGPWWIRVGKGK